MSRPYYRIISGITAIVFLLQNAAIACPQNSTLQQRSSLQQPDFRAIVKVAAENGFGPDQFTKLKDLSDAQKREITEAVLEQAKAILGTLNLDANVGENLTPFQILTQFIEKVSPKTNPTERAYLNNLLIFLQSVVGGNIASGVWPAEHEEKLHAQFKELFNDTEHDVTKRYEVKVYIDALKLILSNIALEDESLRRKLLASLDNPTLKLFFFNPQFGNDKFSTVVMDADGKAGILEAEAHFGHNKKGEENIYIASRAFDGKTIGERLGLIAHEITHLVLGRGDDVDVIAKKVEQTVVTRYDTTSESESLRLLTEKIPEYLTLKKDLFTAVQDNKREEAEKIYRQWMEVIDIVGGLESKVSGISVDLIVLGLFGNTEESNALAMELNGLKQMGFNEDMKQSITETVDDIVKQVFSD